MVSLRVRVVAPAACVLAVTAATATGAVTDAKDQLPQGPCATAHDLDAIQVGWKRQQVTKQIGYLGVSIDYRRFGGVSTLNTTYREQSVRAYAGCRGAMGVLVGFERKVVDGRTPAWRVVKVRSLSL